MKKLISALLSICLISIAGCNSNDGIDNPFGINDDTLKVNKFIVDVFDDIYLWVDDIDMETCKKTYNRYKDPYEFFEKLRYIDDEWSGLTDDIEGMNDSFEGVETSFGYSLFFGYAYKNSDIVIGIVKFVYPDSPAEKAGLKRGDILVSMNGNDITDKNYPELVYSSSISVSRGYYDGSQYNSYGESISMTAIKQYNNPIIKDTIIVKGVNKIGYLCYSDFLEKSETELIRIFNNFKKQAVTDVVLDLRYNPGGLVRTSIVLSSILAPGSAVINKDIYQIQVWNDNYTQYYTSKGNDMKEYFTDTLPVNMNLSRLFVLTSENSASASEATIISLKPYMNVIQIGSKTSGKFCGGGLISPDMIYKDSKYYNNIKNWGMYIMYFRYTNKSQTYYKEGLEPDIEAKENFLDLKPFGDERDPLLGRAIAHITGQQYVESRSEQSMSDFKISNDLYVKKQIDGKLIDNRKLQKLLKED
ncbi:MAG: PDZ domain-containing protein [Tannerella sp.]|jgi:C-terminal processing protease CtpA/Prc|nr:PDZ domain-containing protein [Tannerella sp.]